DLVLFGLPALEECRQAGVVGLCHLQTRDGSADELGVAMGTLGSWFSLLVEATVDLGVLEGLVGIRVDVSRLVGATGVQALEERLHLLLRRLVVGQLDGVEAVPAVAG